MALTAYIDASVLLRLILGEPDKLIEWNAIETAVTSALTEVECLRSIDRAVARGRATAASAAQRRAAVFDLMQDMRVVEINRALLARASEPFPTPLGTLDAIHLSTALMWREQEQTDLVMATHDAELALAARSLGFTVVGG